MRDRTFGGMVCEPQALALAGPGLLLIPAVWHVVDFEEDIDPEFPRVERPDVQPGACRRPTGWPSRATRSTGS